MKPFKFSLQRLLNYKENVLDKEKNTLPLSEQNSAE